MRYGEGDATLARQLPVFGLPLFWLGLGLLLLQQSRVIASESFGDSVGLGAGTFPAAVGGFLTVLGVYLTFREVRLLLSLRGYRPPGGEAFSSREQDNARERPVTDDQGPIEPEELWRPLVTILICAAYIVALDTIGFIVATMAASAAIAGVTARRVGILISLAFPIGLTATMFLLFSSLLSIRLP